MNARPGETSVTIIIPTNEVPTENPQSWQAILQAGFGSNSTPLPTVAPAIASFVPPTLPSSSDANLTPIAPAQLSNNPAATAPVAATATPLAGHSRTGVIADVTAQVVTRPPADWQPPPLIPPISRDPFGRDHYVFARPVDSNATNFALFSYSYGSDGATAGKSVAGASRD